MTSAGTLYFGNGGGLPAERPTGLLALDPTKL